MRQTFFVCCCCIFWLLTSLVVQRCLGEEFTDSFSLLDSCVRATIKVTLTFRYLKHPANKSTLQPIYPFTSIRYRVQPFEEAVMDEKPRAAFISVRFSSGCREGKLQLAVNKLIFSATSERSQVKI